MPRNIIFKIFDSMKKILFAAFAVVAMGFVSCGNNVQSGEGVDSTSVDTVAVDSVDSVAIVVDSVATK